MQTFIYQLGVKSSYPKNDFRLTLKRITLMRTEPQQQTQRQIVI